jgi:DNA-binding NarL/FixJ family response regulator
MDYRSLTLAIADDHTLFRKGVLELLKSFSEITVLADADNGAELIEKVEAGIHPDIVMLDLEMPELDGIATARYLLSKYPQIKIIILSMYGEVPLVEKLVEEGVHGYLLKSAEPTELRIALQALLNGQHYFSQINENSISY